MMENVFNAFVLHYFCNYLMNFQLSLIVGFGNKMWVATLKDFLVDKTPEKPWDNYFEPIKYLILVRSKHSVQ